MKAHGLQNVKTHGLQVCGAGKPLRYIIKFLFRRVPFVRDLLFFLRNRRKNENIFSQPIDTRRIIVYNINSDNNYRY